MAWKYWIYSPIVAKNELFFAFLKLKSVSIASKIKKKCMESGASVAAQMFLPFSLCLDGCFTD